MTLYFLTYPATLQIHVNTVEVNQSSTKAELSCRSSCSEPSYVWFKNGQNVFEGASYKGYFNPGDSISCALKGNEDYRSPLLCEFTSLSHRQICQTFTQVIHLGIQTLCKQYTSTVRKCFLFPSRCSKGSLCVSESLW